VIDEGKQRYMQGDRSIYNSIGVNVKLTRIILNRRSGEDIIHVHLLINLAISYYTKLILTCKVILVKHT